MTAPKTIVICCSAAFYHHANRLAGELERREFNVIVPATVRQIRQTGDYDIDKVKTWYRNTADRRCFRRRPE